jgi:hypothetical protein
MRSGSTARGEVTAVEINRFVKINGRYPRYLKYRFIDCNGIAREGRSPNLPLSLEDKWSAGDSITIIYDLRDGDNHQPDIFELQVQSRRKLAKPCVSNEMRLSILPGAQTESSLDSCNRQSEI